jgi:signal transduction histidine kinase
MACEVCVPLKAAGRLIAFITVGNKYDKKAYTLEDFHFLSLLANEAAIALENTRLYEDLKQSQELLARSDRLAAVGTLAAGIAHEIRNPLVSIHTFTQLLPERLDDPEFRTTFLRIASDEVARASALIDDLLTFARPSPSATHQVDLNAILEQMVRLLDGQAKKKAIRLIFSPSASLLPVLADEGQLKQVFMNLLLNALQATPQGGEISLTTQTVRDQRGKECCRVVVQDTGEGILPEHKEQIFDPFFTTKSSGTGLGLFIAYQIVAEHGGYIDVESLRGEGTSFYVHLPYPQAQEVETPYVTLEGRRMETAAWVANRQGR